MLFLDHPRYSLHYVGQGASEASSLTNLFPGVTAICQVAPAAQPDLPAFEIRYPTMAYGGDKHRPPGGAIASHVDHRSPPVFSSLRRSECERNEFPEKSILLFVLISAVNYANKLISDVKGN